MKTTRLAIILFLAVACSGIASAQSKQLSDDDRDRFLNEMRVVKHEFLTRELKLTKEQQADFFPIYDQTEAEISRINTETRELEQAALTDPNASEIHMEAAARAAFEQKEREARVELDAYEKYKAILTPQQLVRLKSTEKRFTQQLMREHRKAKAKR